MLTDSEVIRETMDHIAKHRKSSNFVSIESCCFSSLCSIFFGLFLNRARQVWLRIYGLIVDAHFVMQVRTG